MTDEFKAFVAKHLEADSSSSLQACTVRLDPKRVALAEYVGKQFGMNRQKILANLLELALVRVWQELLDASSTEEERAAHVRACKAIEQENDLCQRQ